MKFVPIFGLHLTHAYYSNGRRPDFRIEPTPETQKLLDNHRYVLKAFTGRIRVLATATDGGIPLIPLQNGMTFRFYLRLQDPEFALFTDLAEMTQTPAPLYTNAGVSSDQPVQLALVSRQAQSSESFVVREPAPEDRFSLSGSPLAGLAHTDFIVEGLGATTSLTQYDAATKIITINTESATSGNTFKVTYSTAPKRSRNVFADIEIHNNDSLPEIADGPGAFRIAFNAKVARWSYYVVTDTTNGQFHIEDKDSPPIIFSDGNRTDLNQQPDASDNIATMLAKQYPDLQRFRFVSDKKVACRQQPRKSIQLLHNSDKVLAPLPNPSIRNYSTIEMIKNGNPQKEDTLFQIVKYITL